MFSLCDELRPLFLDHRHRWLTASLIALACAGQSHIAGAQSAKAAPQQVDQGSIGDIVVTAQRRAERLQDVPIAITATTAQALSDRNMNDLSALANATPSLRITGSAGAAGTNLVAIRGISGQPVPIGAPQAVAIYLDGVYLPRSDAAFFALDDVERIEVLRGPQGTLYGRNATAGSINIITRTPGDEVKGGVDVNYGNYNAVNAKGSLSGPLGGGFSAGVSGSYSRHDGWFTNNVTGNRVAPLEAYAVRGKLRYDSPDDMFDATFSIDKSLNDTASVYHNPYDLVNNGVFVGVGDPFVISSDALSESLLTTKVKSWGASLTANVRPASDLTLTAVASYRYFYNKTIYDIDSTALRSNLADNNNMSQPWSFEFRGVWSPRSLRVTFGANYYHEYGARQAYVGVPYTTPTRPNAQANTTKLDAYAAFTQVEFDLSRRLTIVGGLRFNAERRSFDVDYRTQGGVITYGRLSDNVLIPSVGVNYKPGNDILLYAKYSQGYQAPGFVYTPGISVRTPVTFNPEHLDSYEVGVKSQLFDRRVTLNLTGFYYDYKNIQVRTTPSTGIVNVTNAAAATLKGIEGSLAVQIAPGLSLDSYLTYMSSRYDRFCENINGGAPQNGDPLCSAGLADRSGNRLQNAPKWQGGATLTFIQPIGEAGTLRATAAYSVQTKSYFTPSNEELLSSAGYNSGTLGVLDGRVGFQLRSGPEVYVFGRNLLNRTVVDYALRGSPTQVTLHNSDPRQYGVGLRYRF